MLLTKSCMYGIQAAIFVAAQPSIDYVPIGRISAHLGVSFHFLTKVLQNFNEAGLMLSYRGPKGGVALARPSAHISVYDMVCAIDGDQLFTSCILGLPGCGSQSLARLMKNGPKPAFGAK